jgi:hypothetical protein
MNDIERDTGGRRGLLLGLLATAAVLAAPRAIRAQGLAGIASVDQVAALRAALNQGASSAVGLLGKADGFWSNPQVKIPLPDTLERLRSPARLLGMGGQFDELHLSMNRAAEQAVPQSISLLQGAIKSMSVQDAQGILTGSQTAATEYFRKVTGGELFKRFLPVVTKSTEKVGLANQYNALAERGASLGVVNAKEAKLEPWVTNKALDGLFFMVGEEEKKIRTNPVGAASDIARRVFGAIGR